MLDLCDLERFLVACQEASLASAASVLRVATSSLSVSIGKLERELGLRLFDRTGRGLLPNRSANWLFLEALNVLNAEAFSRRQVNCGSPEPRTVTVGVGTGTVIGQTTLAIANAVVQAALASPGTYFKLHQLTRKSRDAVTGPSAGVELFYADDEIDASLADLTLLAMDPLVLARKGRHADSSVTPATWSGPLVVPQIPGVAFGWVRERLLSIGCLPAANITDVHEGLDDAEGLLLENTELGVVAPLRALPCRWRLGGFSLVQIHPDLRLRILASSPRDDPAVTVLLDALRHAMSETNGVARLVSDVTFKQVDTFLLLARTLSVTNAAKQAGVAQPAVTGQLKRLERTLSAKLFDRGRSGVSLTHAGRRFHEGAALLDGARGELTLRRPRAVDAGSGRFEVGILPAVGSNGFLISRVARAIDAWRVSHPQLQLRLLELPNAVLQERVRRGTLDLGIITTRSPRLARFDLKSSEALALVANPSSELVPAGEIQFSGLANLPLVLPTVQFGLRQLIDLAGSTLHIALRPVLEVDSLSMCLALVKESRLATILPPSDVVQQTSSGELSVHAIVNPQIVRTIQIIYSTQRSLTSAERDLVNLLRSHLSATEEGVDVSDDPPSSSSPP